MGTFFSDTFGVASKTLEDYGAFDISIINDLPLFIDPFLLFHSEKDEYRTLHNLIIEYLAFLRDRAVKGPIDDGLLRNWYCFQEVKQNWLGFSLVGNSGSGLGIEFARQLHSNLGIIFSNFGGENITESSHLEKVCLIAEGVGRDNISDFVTNLIKDFLCQYTEKFARTYLSDDQTRDVSIDHAIFDYETESWKRRRYRLPWHEGDFIILTPRDMLTRDDTWINKNEMIKKFEQIPESIPDSQLRASVDNYFHLALKSRTKPKRLPTSKERHEAAADTIQKFPELIDYYIKLKEITGDDAADLSTQKVLLTEIFFSQSMRAILQPKLKETGYLPNSGWYLC